MRPPRLLGIAFALACWVLAPAAQGQPASRAATKVFPLTAAGALPSGLEEVPERLTGAIAKLVGAKVSDTPIRSAALAAGCSLADAACLEQIARTNRVQELVFGTLRVGDDRRVVVKLTRFIAGAERRERTFVLTSETPAALARQLGRSARDMFEAGGKGKAEDEDGDDGDDGEDGEEPRAGGEDEEPRRAPLDELLEDEPGAARGARGKRDERGEPGERDEPADDPPPARGGRVTLGTYLLISGGAMTVAVGTGFAIGAYSLHDDLRSARATTPDDTRRIAAIERAIRLRSTVGTVLLVGGGLAVAGGVVRAVIQRRQPAADRSLSVVPLEGGAALVFSGQLP